jgi:hypothetical protein
MKRNHLAALALYQQPKKVLQQCKQFGHLVTVVALCRHCKGTGCALPGSFTTVEAAESIEETEKEWGRC